MIYVVYILRTSDNTLYTGVTNNLKKRLEKHKKKKGAKYLRSFNSFTLVYTEDHKTKSDALKREYALKQLSKKEKEKLVTDLGN